MNETKLKTKDLVNIGIFSVIYMALSMAVMIIPILSPILWLLWPAMTGIICNFIYMLLVSKVPKPGTALLLIAITGIIYFAIGECTFTIVITCVIAGVLAEITRKILGYKSQKRNSIFRIDLHWVDWLTIAYVVVPRILYEIYY